MRKLFIAPLMKPLGPRIYDRTAVILILDNTITVPEHTTRKERYSGLFHMGDRQKPHRTKDSTCTDCSGWWNRVIS